MAVTQEENELAERVVEAAKRVAAVDSGRLKRSINKKVQRGGIVFREYFYGQYESNAGIKNSYLEELAKSMMGNVPYKIERLNEDGSIEEITSSRNSGRRASEKVSKETPMQNARKLIKSIQDTKKRIEAKEKRNGNTDSDNSERT